MPKANPIIIDDKCNIQDGIVFHDPIGCLKGLYPAWRYRARSAWRRRRSYRNAWLRPHMTIISKKKMIL
jgi:hypothetical protein